METRLPDSKITESTIVPLGFTSSFNSSVALEVAEPNDTLSQAKFTGLDSTNPGTFFDSGVIGDNPNIISSLDVDLFVLQLEPGDEVTIDIDAQVFGSFLDSILRIFDSAGNEVAVNDDSDSLDSFLNFTAVTSDTYYVGVSGFSNFSYNPFFEGSGTEGSIGEYEIIITVENFIAPSPPPLTEGLENGDFENGDFTNWATVGNISIETSAFGRGPSEGTFQALLTNGDGSVTDIELESFLGLPFGSLDGLGNGDVTEGSAIARRVEVLAGDVLTFDFNFLTNEGTPSFFNDFAFVAITPDTATPIELADTSSFFNPFLTFFFQETGFQTFSYEFTSDGIFTLGVGVVDVGDTVVDSGLLVDNFEIFRTIDGGNGKEDLFGSPFNDQINGFNGQDTLIGLAGDDTLNGGNGSDTLIGVDIDAANPGRGEVDVLTGENGPDTFVLGDEDKIYYDDGHSNTQGLGDYGLITDFNNEDVIQLNGEAADYFLDDTFILNGSIGTAIFFQDTVNELIGFAQGVTGLNLNSNDFSFVS